MADNGAEQSKDVWPLSKFYFQVEWGTEVMYFQEVSGLDVQSRATKYRHGDSPVFSAVEMLGMVEAGNVTMRRGVFKGDDKSWGWLNKIQMNTIERVPVTISLLDENGAPTMVWTLANAWPTKITATDMKSEGNEVAIETIEIAHEGLEVANA